MLCVGHLNQNAPAGTERAELNAVYAEAFNQHQLPTGRAFVSTLTDANQYAFTNAYGDGHGTRVNSDTVAWAFDGDWPPMAGAYLGVGARQFTTPFNYGGTDARLGAGGFLPVVTWFGGGIYYVQSTGNGTCTETVVLTGTVGTTSYYEQLLPPQPCIVEAPALPPVVQP